MKPSLRIGSLLCIALHAGCVEPTDIVPMVQEHTTLEPPTASDAGSIEDAGTSATLDAGSTTDAGVIATYDAGSIDTATDAGSIAPPFDAGVDAGPIAIDAGAIAIDAGPIGPIVRRSAGCGLGAATNFGARTIVVRGRTRTYHLFVPPTYDANRVYPIIFKWHGWGGNGLSGGLGIEYFSGEEAIVVAPDAIDGTWDLSTAGADAELFDLLLASIGSSHCVDLDRVFSYGFSRGGGMTSMLACTRPAVIRGSAAVAGLEPWVGACAGPVATWFIHDSGDPSVPIDQGVRTRDRFLASNGCGASTTPVAPSPCVSYAGCSEPVVWCQTSGRGHDIRGDLAPQSVWSFFRSLP
jgi:polyhydroxybutyrate depolymerase